MIILITVVPASSRFCRFLRCRSLTSSHLRREPVGNQRELPRHQVTRTDIFPDPPASPCFNKTAPATGTAGKARVYAVARNS